MKKPNQKIIYLTLLISLLFLVFNYLYNKKEGVLAQEAEVNSSEEISMVAEAIKNCWDISPRDITETSCGEIEVSGFDGQVSKGNVEDYFKLQSEADPHYVIPNYVWAAGEIDANDGSICLFFETKGTDEAHITSWQEEEKHEECRALLPEFGKIECQTEIPIGAAIDETEEVARKLIKDLDQLSKPWRGEIPLQEFWTEQMILVTDKEHCQCSSGYCYCNTGCDYTYAYFWNPATEEWEKKCTGCTARACYGPGCSWWANMYFYNIEKSHQKITELTEEIINIIEDKKIEVKDEEEKWPSIKSIKAKLNYSRNQLSQCYTPSEDIAEVMGGEKSGQWLFSCAEATDAYLLEECYGSDLPVCQGKEKEELCCVVPPCAENFFCCK